MLRLVLVYGSSAGIHRAMVFLAVPLLAQRFPLEVLGVYTLVQTLSQLAGPMLTLNGTVALTREATEHPSDAKRLLILLGGIGCGALLIGLLVTLSTAPLWLAFGIMLGAVEAAFGAATAVLRGREAANTVLIISTLKTMGFITIIWCVTAYSIDIHDLLAAQIANGLVATALAGYWATHVLKGGGQGAMSLRAMLGYSVATLPHTAAFWLSVSSDRMLLGLIRGPAELGAYALAYTVAQAVTLVMVGVVTALPPRVARHPEYWRNPSHVLRFIRWTTLACAFVILLTLVAVFVNQNVFPFIDKMPHDALVLVALIGAGFGASFYYVLFASYMYLNRSTGALARAGFILGPANLVAMAVLVYLSGAIGAACGALLCYGSFGFAYGRIAVKLEPQLRGLLAQGFLHGGALTGFSLLLALLLS